MYYKKFKYNY